ncbi:MFS transporter [Bacillus sonorensis]|uniref:MFS transporter n=1 Tax=Bacillus sonorensis TaxID=119858 RepID=UPI001F335D3B|nr:MFS transporter [Bacillus sonorensis]MCF7617110.1 MFS transporter [Bacillus sonorensis]MCY7859232.1 MFS transporter [Bacillus sonorensis]MCY8027832.1 MFS transporter [Bacillus sonorensis]MCY8033878.1 MFS transporter [Bacillus sonorensis]MCY8089871.1 MFS transporter [Bacillus sonorensis]
MRGMKLQSSLNNGNGFHIVVIMCMGIFLCMLDTTIMNITIPSIQSDLHLSLEQISWALNIYTIIFAVFSISFGRIADILGRHKVYIFGIILFAFGSLFCALSKDANCLITGRGIQSIGAAIVFPTSMVIGVDAVPLEKRNSALAILGVTQGLAAALGPAIGGMITQYASWRWVFLINLPICIISILLCCIYLNIKNEQKLTVSIDWLGLIFSGVSIFSLTLVLVKGNEWGWISLTAVLCYAISLVFLLLFLLTEKYCKNPMVNLHLFKDRQFNGAAVTVVLSNLFLIGVTVILPTYLTKVQNESELRAALLMTPVSAMIFICSPIAAFVIKKLGSFITVFTGFILMFIAYFVLYHVDMGASYTGLVISCFILGAGYGIIVGPITVLAASSFKGEMLTASQSVVAALRQIGIVLAVAIYVSSLDVNINNSKEHIFNHAKTVVKNFSLTEEQKTALLETTKKNLDKENINAVENQERQVVSSKEREQLINHKIDKKLRDISENGRKYVRNSIKQEVTAEVDKHLAQINKTVSDYQHEITRFRDQEVNSAFLTLYKVSLPFILFSSLVSFLFLKRRVNLRKINKSKADATR